MKLFKELFTICIEEATSLPSLTSVASSQKRGGGIVTASLLYPQKWLSFCRSIRSPRKANPADVEVILIILVLFLC